MHVARQAFERADRELEAGASAQDEQGMRRSRFTAVGLHWLRGLVRLQAGDSEGARASLERELAFEPAGHLYTRECCANVHYALGALAARAGDRDGAIAACGRALTYATGHAMPLALHAALTDRDVPAPTTRDLDERLVTLRTHGQGIDAAAAAVVPAVLRGDTASAAAVLDEAVAHAPPGPQGWLLPVDPVLRMSEDPQVWGGVLALLRARAA